MSVTAPIVCPAARPADVKAEVPALNTVPKGLVRSCAVMSKGRNATALGATGTLTLAAPALVQTTLPT